MAIRRWLSRITRRFVGDTGNERDAAAPGEDGATIPAEADADVAVSYDPSEIERRADTLSELGLEPEEFVLRLLEEANGRLRQQAFTDYTDWSEATVSHLLSEMEADRHIVRTSVGHQKVVCLPEQVPEPTTNGSADDSDDSKAV